MATEVMMPPAAAAAPMQNQRKGAKNSKLPPENERYLRACSEVASALIQEYETQRDAPQQKKDVNLNKLCSQVSRKHKLSNQPTLTAIIAAVPEHHKKYILPKLIAKPIRKLYSVLLSFGGSLFVRS